MGAFNVLKLPNKDLGNSELRIQFKYGDVWQDEYELGDSLKWGGNDCGSPEYKSVVVEGYLENDDIIDQLEYEIYIVDNIIKDIKPLSDYYKKKFLDMNSSFIVL